MSDTQKKPQKHAYVAGEEVDGDVQDVGSPLISWESWEHAPKDRTIGWYAIASVIGVVLLVYAIWTANYFFAIIVLMMGLIFFMRGMREEERVEIHITDMGIVVGREFYDYKDIKEFAIVYEPPIVKTLYVDFNSVLRPMISIPLDDADPNKIRETLLPFVYENLEREDETLTDLLQRVYKL